MKFLQLREALETYEKIDTESRPNETPRLLPGNKGLGGVQADSSKTEGLDPCDTRIGAQVADTPKAKNSKCLSLHGWKKRETVLGGEVIWKPVDKQAAMLVAKAPWWAHPPTEIKTVEKKPKPIKRKKHNNMRQEISGTEVPMGHEMNPGGERGMKIVNGEERVDVNALALRIIEQINKMPQQLTPLARAAIDARTVLDEHLSQIGATMETFGVNAKAALDVIRQTRFAVVTEASMMMNPLKEIRQFFIGPTHDEEIKRLREFVELCERLQKLKESGFLDKVADTMIGLSVK